MYARNIMVAKQQGRIFRKQAHGPVPVKRSPGWSRMRRECVLGSQEKHDQHCASNVVDANILLPN